MFTGAVQDGSGLIQLRARYYHPGWGRFVSEDLIGLTGGVNRYAYALDNPRELIDPSGLEPGKLLIKVFTPGTPPATFPHCPYTPKPPTPYNRLGSWQGPAQPKGPRAQAQQVPPEGEGGPPGSKGYWKRRLRGRKDGTVLITTETPLMTHIQIRCSPNPILPAQRLNFYVLVSLQLLLSSVAYFVLILRTKAKGSQKFWNIDLRRGLSRIKSSCTKSTLKQLETTFIYQVIMAWSFNL